MNPDNKDDASLTAKMQLHFDGISEAYYKIVDSSPGSYGYYHKKELELIRKEILTSRSLKVLDAGCGPGRHSIEIARNGHELVAVDFSNGMVEKTRNGLSEQKLTGKAKILQADIRNLPFENECFDLVVNMEVLEHLPGYLADCEKSIKEFYRVLKKGGKLIIEAPLKPHRIMLNLTKYNPKLRGISKEEHELYYLRNPLLFANTFWEKDIQNLLLERNFKVECKKHIRFFHEALTERLAFLDSFEAILEAAPIINKLCRESIWVCRK